MFTGVSSVISFESRDRIGWKQPKCLSTDEWIKRYVCMCVYVYKYIYIHTQWEFYSTIKRMKFYHLQ